MSLFGALNTSSGGLKVSQVATDVISNNISNAEDEFYTRQRVNVSQKPTIKTSIGTIGTGANINEIIRIHNEFTFQRFRDAGTNLENASFKQQVMQEIAKYFPEMSDKGLQRDIMSYFDAWQKLASNPSDSSQKVGLAQKTVMMTKSFNEIRKKMKAMQDYMNQQIEVSVNEVNRLGKQIAEINQKITTVEASDYVHANALRDERDKLEVALHKLISANINKTGVASMSEVSMDMADYEEFYSVDVGGYPLIDGQTFHPLVVDASNGENGNLYTIYFQSQDFSLKDISDSITNGKIGALLDLRGRKFDKQTAEPADGFIHEYIEGLDVLARTIIQQTNNIYAKSSDKQMVSNEIGKTIQLTSSQKSAQLKPIAESYGKKVQKGDMVFSIYDLDGQILQKEIKVSINPETESLKDVVENINNKFIEENIDAEATIELGVLRVKTGGNSTGQKLSAVLIKEDNSLLTSAFNMNGDLPLSKVDATEIPFDITNGTFEIGVYDSAGTQIATRTIKIDKDSQDPLFSTLHGIVAQINMAYTDDNNDNDYTNDIDDIVTADFKNDRFTIQVKDENAYFNIIDNQTGFAGAIGLHKFLKGESAANMAIMNKFEDNPPDINAYSAPVEGNNEVANDMQQLQYNDVAFFYPNGTTNYDTIIGGYRYYAGKLAESVHSIDTSVDTYKAVHSSIKEQQDSISKVSVDEELTNLLMFQNGYGANAKVITTIQQMLDTLLSIKQ